MSHESKTEQPESFSDGSMSGSNDFHDRIQSKLNELHTDFRQLRSDIRAAKESGERALKDESKGSGEPYGISFKPQTARTGNGSESRDESSTPNC